NSGLPARVSMAAAAATASLRLCDFIIGSLLLIFGLFLSPYYRRQKPDLATASPPKFFSRTAATSLASLSPSPDTRPPSRSGPPPKRSRPHAETIGRPASPRRRRVARKPRPARRFRWP